MQEQTRQFFTSQQDSVTVVEFTERKILDEMNISKIGEELSSLVTQSEHPRLVLDFTHVLHMSSTALGMLITLHKRVRERDGQLRLCRIRPEIYEVFAITKLNEIFQIHEDRDSAMASLRK